MKENIQYEWFVNRAYLYLGMTMALLNTKEGALFLKEIGGSIEECNVKALKASLLRRDYDPVTRSLLSKAIASFYEQAGFEAIEDPDSLITMMAFMAQLAKQNNFDSLKVQHRFLRTHLIPTLSYAVEKCSGLKPLKDIVIEDAENLKQILIKGASE